MMIGVLSDTHIPKRAKMLPEIVLTAFKGVDHIVHAGDLLSLEVITQLDRLAPVTAVAGNADSPETQELLGEKKILTLGGFRFGVVHGHGSHGSTVGRAYESFIDDAVDCIIFGHSHIPYYQYHGHILMFNPGSPTDKRRNKQFSIGIFEINETLTAKHIFFL